MPAVVFATTGVITAAGIVKRCISTLGCPELALDEARELAGRFGLDGIEVRALTGTTEVIQVLQSRFDTPGNLARHLVASPLPGVVAFDTSLRLATASDRDRAALLDFVPWAEATQVRWLRVFDGGCAADARGVERALETLAWWRRVRAANGWRCDIMVETHDSLLSGAAIAAFVARAPGTAILWDSHHTWRRGGEAPGATWRHIAGAVSHVHVKDSTTSDCAAAFEYVRPGEGEFPMAELRHALAASRFAGVLSLEWERLWIPALPSVEEALQSATRHAWW